MENEQSNHLPTRLTQVASEIAHGHGNKIGAPYWWGEACMAAVVEINVLRDSAKHAQARIDSLLQEVEHLRDKVRELEFELEDAYEDHDK